MGAVRASLCAVSILMIGALVPLAQAQSQRQNPYRALVALTGIEKAMRPTHSRAELENVPTVRIRGRVFSSGNIDVRLTQRRNKTWRSVITTNGVDVEDPIQPTLLRGAVVLGGGLRMRGRRVMPTGAYVVGSTLKVSFAGRAKGSRQSRQRIYTITMRLDGTIVIQAKVTSIPRSAMRKAGCANAAPPASAASASGGRGDIVKPLAAESGVRTMETARVVTLSTDADQEWYKRYGESSNAVIAGLVNLGEAIYARQLGIRFRIVKQHAYAGKSPYVSTDAMKLLSSFTFNEANANNLSDEPLNFSSVVDIKHLFSGKNIDGSVIGIAYIGVVCSSPILTYGVTSHYNDAADFAIFAHEVGHNFGANHDESDEKSLMYPSISVPPADSFSNASLNEINRHLYGNSSCISVEEVAPRPDITPAYPTPQPPEAPDLNYAIIKIKRARVGDRHRPVVRISGTIVSPAGVPIPKVKMKLLAAGQEVGVAPSNAKGEFSFFLRLNLPEDREIYLYSETVGGESFSNFIWLGSTKPM